MAGSTRAWNTSPGGRRISIPTSTDGACVSWRSLPGHALHRPAGARPRQSLLQHMQLSGNAGERGEIDADERDLARVLWLQPSRTSDAIARYLITRRTPPPNTVYPTRARRDRRTGGAAKRPRRKHYALLALLFGGSRTDCQHRRDGEAPRRAGGCVAAASREMGPSSACPQGAWSASPVASVSDAGRRRLFRAAPASFGLRRRTYPENRPRRAARTLHPRGFASANGRFRTCPPCQAACAGGSSGRGECAHGERVWRSGGTGRSGEPGRAAGPRPQAPAAAGRDVRKNRPERCGGVGGHAGGMVMG